MTILKNIRSQFPILKQKIGEYPLVYLDNASTTQKPDAVIDAVAHYYRHANSNVNRAAHHLAALSDQIVEEVRTKIFQWLHAKSPQEIIFTASTTASINMVVYSYGEQHIKEGDEILVSAMEHTSNWLPWYVLAKKKRAVLKEIPITQDGEIDLSAYKKLLSSRTKIVAISHVSNVLGSINPIKKMTAEAHKYEATVIVDAAQSIAHLPINVEDIGCDFLAFSSHKMYGPTGLGVLYVSKKKMTSMVPSQLGGGMLRSVQPNRIIYEQVPHAFEGGTLHLAGVAGLGAALAFLESISYKRIHAHEKALLTYATQQLKTIPGLHIWGNAAEKLGIVSFTIDTLHPLDIGIRLDAMGIAVRTGKHCATTLMKNLPIEGAVRASLAVYNTKEDIDRLVHALFDIKRVL